MATPIHVGLDVHKDTIAIVVAILPRDDSALQVIECGNVANTAAAMKRKVIRLADELGPGLHFIYEAGP
ncbi:MAG: hypothetical protein OXG05_09975 [Gammaproteobacteria bacterium]|nr:hypothetical protein [Gammaproteobacteria bacterium]